MTTDLDPTPDLAPDPAPDDTTSVSLWEGDEGGLEHAQRLALVTLLKSRFISARTHPRDWTVLVEHERVIRSRLNDLFLELAIDRTREVAWKRQAVSEAGARLPTLLYRLRAGHAGGDARVYIDRDDVLDHVATFRPAHATDEAGDEKRARNAFTSVVKAGLLIPTASEDRFEISEAVEPLLPLELQPPPPVSPWSARACKRSMRRRSWRSRSAPPSPRSRRWSARASWRACRCPASSRPPRI